MRIGVIGAGHAGVEAAWRASQLGAEVVLFSGESVPPVLPAQGGGPGLRAGGAGQHLPEAGAWYREHGIDLRLNSEVTHLDGRSRIVTVADEKSGSMRWSSRRGPPRLFCRSPGSFPRMSFPCGECERAWPSEIV